jgi:hypothetical protein
MKVNIKTLVVYYILFYLAWGLSEYVIGISNPVLYSIVREGIVKNLVWTLPAYLLIKQHHDSVEIPLKEMFTNKVKWVNYLPIFVLFGAYILMVSFRANGGIVISSSFGVSSIITVLFVGITEELVFRGWLLNATIKGKQDDDTYLPMFINSLLFLSIHFPKWLHQGTFVSSFTSLGFVQIIVLSCLFSYVFIKSRNVLVPIALHMFWDLLVFMFG